MGIALRQVTILLPIFLPIFITTLANKTCEIDTGDEFQGSHVGLIISPIMSNKVIRELEIYWNHVNYRPGDKIGLYTVEPDGDDQPIYSLQPNASTGIRRTGIQAEFLPTSNLTFARRCLKYHVAWVRDGKIRKKNCLETRPNWMAEMRQIIGPLTMNKVFLPGTHDSASYAIYEHPKVETIIEKYAITQDVDVLAQLIYGVRYLDIRVGHYPFMNTVWWANHGLYRAIPMDTVIEQVKTFLDNTEEIVIFDIQEFPVGFGDNLTVHREFVSFLERRFAKHLLPRTEHSWSSTLDSIWSSGRRLIIGYDNNQVVNLHESLWPCVTHQWGNVRSVKDLYEYLNRIENAGRTSYWTNPRSAMAELTPNTWDVILNRLGGLRQMANNVNTNVTNWYGNLWQHSANIVAVDFVRSSGIIETAIEWNQRRRYDC